MKTIKLKALRCLVMSSLGLVIAVSGWSQNVSKVEGIVSNESGEPLKAVSIQYGVSTSKELLSSISDENGKFALNDLMVGQKYRFDFSYVGYENYSLTSFIIQKGESNKLIIRLKQASQGLDEVIVVGFGRQKKKDVTGAVSSVKGERLIEVPSPDISNALQGRVAGVVVQTQSWRPGSTTQIRIRGNRSINAMNEPLYVVDGIPTTDAIEQISPNDIESVEILKDASATAIYGNRGANGVVIITTKKGKKGKTLVDFNSYYGIQKNKELPLLMNAAEFVEYSREAQRNIAGGTYDSKPNRDQDFKNEQLVATPFMFQNMERAWESGTYDPSKLLSTDWVDYGLKTGAIQDYNVNVRGGSEATKFLLSTDYFQNTGVVRDQDYKRFSVRINAEHHISKGVKIGTNSVYTSSTQNAGWNDVFDVYGLKSFNPLASPFDEDGNLELFPTNNTRTPNPITNFGNTKRIRNLDRYLGNFYLDANLLPGLNFRSNFGIDLRVNQNFDFNSENTAIAGGIAPSSAANNTAKKFMYTWENILSYTKTIHEDHNIFATLVQSIQEEKIESNGISVTDLPYDELLNNNLGSALIINGVSSGLVDWNLSSFLGRVNYGYKNKYLVTLSARYDGSSRLAEGEKWVLFPSVAFAWRLKDEGFLKDTKNLSELKLRLSYGKTGNTSIDPYKTWGRVGTNRYVFGESTILGFTPIEMLNPQLTWETTDQFNAGVDVGFLNNRISASLDFYLQNTSNLLLARQLPTVSGFSNLLSNIGKTQNKGFELTLNTVNVSNRNFSWRTDLLFNANKQKIVELYNGKVDDVGALWFIGKPVNLYYNLGFNGIWQNTQDDLQEIAKFNANGSNFRPGDIRPLDKNGDFRIDANDRYIIGQVDPKWTIGFANNFTYKNFDASIFMNGMFGHTLNHDLDLRFDGRYNQPKMNFWTPANPSKEAPRPLLGAASVNYLSTMNYYSGDFVRVKNILVGYTLPKGAFHNLSIDRLRIYASVQNPFLFTKFPGTDPEGATGFDDPSVVTYTFGLNLSF